MLLLRILGILASMLLMTLVGLATWALATYVPGGGLKALCLVGFYVCLGLPLLAEGLSLLFLSIAHIIEKN